MRKRRQPPRRRTGRSQSIQPRENSHPADFRQALPVRGRDNEMNGANLSLKRHPSIYCRLSLPPARAKRIRGDGVYRKFRYTPSPVLKIVNRVLKTSKLIQNRPFPIIFFQSYLQTKLRIPATCLLSIDPFGK